MSHVQHIDVVCRPLLLGVLIPYRHSASVSLQQLSQRQALLYIQSHIRPSQKKQTNKLISLSISRQSHQQLPYLSNLFLQLHFCSSNHNGFPGNVAEGLLSPFPYRARWDSSLEKQARTNSQQTSILGSPHHLLTKFPSPLLYFCPNAWHPAVSTYPSLRTTEEEKRGCVMCYMAMRSAVKCYSCNSPHVSVLSPS